MIANLINAICPRIRYSTQQLVIGHGSFISQELGGNATMLFYQSEEGNEVRCEVIVVAR